MERHYTMAQRKVFDEKTEIKIPLDYPPLQLKSYSVAKCVQLLKGSVQQN
jgi:hypothetical protein